MRLNFEQLTDMALGAEIEHTKNRQDNTYLYLYYVKPIQVEKKKIEHISYWTDGESSGFNYPDPIEKEPKNEYWLDPDELEPLISNRTFSHVKLVSDKEEIIKSWRELEKRLGLKSLTTICTKLPKAVAVKLEKYAERKGETVSSQIRKLVIDWLETKLKDDAKLLIFS